MSHYEIDKTNISLHVLFVFVSLGGGVCLLSLLSNFFAVGLMVYLYADMYPTLGKSTKSTGTVTSASSSFLSIRFNDLISLKPCSLNCPELCLYCNAN